MKKNDRISILVSQLPAGAATGSALDPHYTSYFTCFNARRYYDAHDVLEHLWLQCRDENALFYKGLIQVAGAFVHLQKQFLHPLHPKHGRRLRPASRLFQLGAKSLAPFAPHHLHLDVEALCLRCAHLSMEIIAADYARNPWHPAHAPELRLGEETRNPKSEIRNKAEGNV